VDYLYGVALDKFRQEEQPAKGKKDKQGTKGPQYLLAAARMAYLGSKLPVSQFVSLMAESIVEGEWDGDEANAAGLPPG
jgi:hypothetical protein